MKAFVAANIAACLTTAWVSKPPINGSSPEDPESGFTCSNGLGLSVRFFPAQGVALLGRNGETMPPQQQSGGSGFICSNGPTTIRGKGYHLPLEIGRIVTLRWKST